MHHLDADQQIEIDYAQVMCSRPSRSLTNNSAYEGTHLEEKGVLPVIHHVLVPTDGSENAERVVRFSTQVADRRQQAEVTVVYVHLRVPPVAQGSPSVQEPGQHLHEVRPLNNESSRMEFYGSPVKLRPISSSWAHVASARFEEQSWAVSAMP